MHLLITDSGVGGLSVCAYAERYLRTYGVRDSVKLTYVNASPENDFGYNSMSSRREKIEYFNRFLKIITETFVPEQIFIACNTLSVLYQDTEFSTSTEIHVQGIVETGVQLLLRHLGQSEGSTVTVFGTPTTIEEQTYSLRLRDSGIDESRIVAQACPSLADTISEDRKGLMAKKKIEEFVDASLTKTGSIETGHLSYLACTHYGYRKRFFFEAFQTRGIVTEVVNPNEHVANEMFQHLDTKSQRKDQENKIEIEFISRYEIPETALETISFFLDNISPNTVRAFRNYTHSPRLF
jgi:glutamate racemase